MKTMPLQVQQVAAEASAADKSARNTAARAPDASAAKQAIPGDTVDPPVSDIGLLKRIVDAVVKQLTADAFDKNALKQLDQILAAVAKSPQNFDPQTQQSIAELKATVAAIPDTDTVTEKTIEDITGQIKKLTDRLAAKLASDGSVADVVLKPLTDVSEGFVSFNSVKDAIAWLSRNKELQADLPWQKLAQTYQNGPVVLKIYESAISDLRASFIAPDNVENEMGHLLALLKADVWKSVAPSALLQVLDQNNVLNLENLLDLDNSIQQSESLLGQGSGPGIAKASTRVPQAADAGFSIAFGQWLQTAMESGLRNDTLATLMPSPQQALPKILLDVMTALGGALPISETLAKTEESATVPMQFSDSRPQSLFVNDLFKAVGLDTEARTFSNTDTPLQTDNANLKTALLTLSRALALAATGDEADAEKERGDMQKTNSDSPALPVASEKGPVLKPMQLLSLATALSQVQTTDMLAGISYCAQTIDKQIKETVNAATTPQQTVQKLFGSDGLSQILTTSKMLSNDFIAAAKDIANSLLDSAAAFVPQEQDAGILQKNVSTPDAPVTKNPVIEAAREIVTSIENATEMLGRISQDITQLKNEYEQFSRAAQTPDPGVANNQGFEKAMQNTLRHIDDLVKNIAAFSQKADHAVTGKMEAVLLHAGKQADVPSQTMHDGLAVLKQHVDQAIGRIESMQVLARQVDLADSKQQVISLPMKIGEEWTGVVIRFVKKRSQKTVPQNRPVALSLHVAPKGLGTVDVFMDFDGSKRYAMRMEFQKPHAKKWFEQNKSDLTKTLVGVGFGVLGIDMKDAAATQKAAASPVATQHGRNNVDVSA